MRWADMRALRIEIAGFKGAAPAAYDFTSPLVFITGRNGQGKSRIREAFDFVLGRDVAGVSGSGKELRAALAGAELDVMLTVELDDGAVQTVRRRRCVEKGTFKKPVVYIGGVEADDTKLAEQLGDLSAPAGTSWLDISEDKLLAELARLGARARAGRESVLSAVRAVTAHNRGALADSLCTALGVKTPPRFVPDEDATEESIATGYAARVTDVLKAVDGCSLATLLIHARDVAKAEVNDAQRALKAIEGSADRSREASVAAEVRPDEVALVDVQVKAADDAFRAAEAERVTAKNALEQGRRPLADWQATRDRLEAKVQAARTRLGGMPAPTADDAAAVDDGPLRAALNAASEYETQVAAERESATKAERDAMFAWGQAENTTRGARAALSVLDGGHCPTCRQAITGDVRAVFDRALADAHDAEDRAKAALDAAREYIQQQRDDLNFAATERANAQRALDAAREKNAAAGRVAAARETYNAAARALDESIAEHATFLAKPAPAEPADAQARLGMATADAAEKSAALEQLRARLTEVSGQVERYKRWRSDLKARTDAEGRKKAADLLMDTVRTAERDLAKAGADDLLSTAAMYLPPDFGEPLVFEGAIGISKDGAFWSGPGLSNAQKLVLALSIDRALDAINGRRLRLVLVEAEALDDSTLDHVCAALEGDVEMGALDCAMLISCHEPPRLVPQWQRIHVGPPSPVRPGGGEPSPRDEQPAAAAPSPAHTPSVIERVVAHYDAGLPLSDAVDAAIFGPDAVAAVGADGVAMARALSGIPPDHAHSDNLDDADMADDLGVSGCPDCERTGGLSPEGAAVLASIVEADTGELTPEELAYAKSLADDRTGVEETETSPAEPPPQAEMPITGVAPKVPPTVPALLPDPAVLDDHAAINALADVGLPVDGLKPAQARDILARRLKDDCPPAVVEATAHAIRKFLPKVPPKGVADWLWRPGQTLGENPPRETLDAVINRLSSRAVNELHTWPGSERRPFDGGEMDNDTFEELARAKLVEDAGYPPRLTPAGVKVWEILHDVAPVQSDAQAARAAAPVLAALDGAGVTEAEARAAIKGMGADALKAMGEDCAQFPRSANMTIGKRRDEIAARLARAGTKPDALADMVAKFSAAFPPAPKRLTKGAVSGDSGQDGADVAPEEGENG